MFRPRTVPCSAPWSTMHAARLPASILLALLWLASASSSSLAQDWPNLRGPELVGAAPSELFEGATAVRFEEVWRRELGSGYSAISVSGSLAVTAAANQGRDAVVAFTATSGEPVWRFDLGPVFSGRNGSDDGPSSSPSIAGGRVFQLHPSGRLVALDLATGSLLWERHYVEDFGAPEPLYGFSSQPMATTSRVILQPGGRDNRLLVALDAVTGDLLWAAGEDVTEHQNPMLWRRQDGDQVVAVGPKAVTGYRAENGDLLWRHELEGRGHAGDITVVDEQRFLLHRHNEDARLIEVGPEPAEHDEVGSDSGNEGRYVPRLVWSSRDLDRTYAIPVVRHGHIYGFDSRFLVCLDLETGERLWKSRPPGAQVFSLVGDQLLTVSNGGDLVSAALSPEGFRETGRRELFADRQVMTPPTFGANLVFVRNLQEIVALEPHIQRSAESPEPTSTVTDLHPVPGFLRDLLATVGAARLAEALADRFPQSPVIADGQAHFLWIGDQEDVAIVGDMTGGYREDPLHRLGDSDVFWKSFDWQPGERWEYQFKLYEIATLDPRNPQSIEGPQGPRSVLVSEGWAPPPACSECPRGRLERHPAVTAADTGADTEREFGLTVYMPSGYTDSEHPLPVVLFVQGREAIDHGGIPEILDALIADEEIAPLLAAFVELPESAWYSLGRQATVELLKRSIVPHLDHSYRTTSASSQRVVVSQAWSFETTFHWLLGSSSFGVLAGQSPIVGEHALDRSLGERLMDRAAAPAPGESPLEIPSPLVLRLDVGTADLVSPDWGLDIAGRSQELLAALEQAGYDVELRQTPGGSNWSRWAGQLPTLLRELFPFDPSP